MKSTVILFSLFCILSAQSQTLPALGKQMEGVAHVALQVDSMEQALDFYSRFMGFNIKFCLPFDKYQVYILDGHHFELEMWEAHDSSDYSGLQQVHHVAFKVANLDKVRQAVIENHYPIMKDIYIPVEGIRELMIAGPGNLTIQFVEEDVPVLIKKSMKGDFDAIKYKGKRY